MELSRTIRPKEVMKIPYLHFYPFFCYLAIKYATECILPHLLSIINTHIMCSLLALWFILQ